MSSVLNMLFLGSGSAFTVGDNNYQSNMILNLNGKNLLVDCGTDIRFSMYEQGLSFNDIDAVYISHLHGDHAGGLEWLGFCRRFYSKKSKPILYIGNKLIESLWAKVLSGSMSCLQDECSSLDTYFNVSAIEEGGNFLWQDINFQLIRTIHTKNNKALNFSYGLLFQYGKNKIFYTTDTVFLADFYLNEYLAADIIFHDCETMPEKSGVHSNYKDLNTLPENIKSKMWLYHYNPGKRPDAIKDGFRGFVMKGQCFKLEK